jgi:CheY-like chemotaxis protein
VVATLSAPAADKGIALDVELAPDLPAWMVGDELRVRQVLVNLLNNAIKFTPAGSVRLHAHRREADGRPLLQLTVTDTGPGIPAEQLDRIFERFEQADNSLTRSHGGTGLGLAICRQLVALMGGKIWVESRLGVGSSFHCTLPLQPAEAPARVAAAQAVQAVSALHILLVDDSEVNREVATMTLEGAHRVTGAGTGLEALALLAQADFDVVLMDVQMPEMDGLAATVAIRAAERGETLPAAVPVELARALATRLGGGHVPIVAMTAHAMDEDRDRCLAAGMDSYLSKPFRHDQLARVLGAVVGDRAEAERAAAKPSPPEDPGR